MKIVAAVDFSAASEAVLKTAKTYAKKLQAEVYLIHIELPEPALAGYEPGPQAVHDQMTRIAKTEQVRLQKDAKALAKAGITVKPMLLQGLAGETIVTEAEQINADLIIIGSHGHGAFHKLLVGSTSEVVLRKATIPVMVIPVKS